MLFTFAYKLPNHLQAWSDNHQRMFWTSIAGWHTLRRWGIQFLLAWSYGHALQSNLQLPRWFIPLGLFLRSRWVEQWLGWRCWCCLRRPLGSPFSMFWMRASSTWSRRFSRSDLWSKLMVFSNIGSIHAEVLAVVAVAGQDGEEPPPPRGGWLLNLSFCFHFAKGWTGICLVSWWNNIASQMWHAWLFSIGTKFHGVKQASLPFIFCLE